MEKSLIDEKKRKIKEYNRKYYLKRKAQTKGKNLESNVLKLVNQVQEKIQEDLQEDQELLNLNFKVFNVAVILLIIFTCNFFLIKMTQEYFASFSSALNSWILAILLELSITSLSFSIDLNLKIKRFKRILIALLVISTSLNCLTPLFNTHENRIQDSKILKDLNSKIQDLTNDINYYKERKNFPSKVSILTEERQNLLENYNTMVKKNINVKKHVYTQDVIAVGLYRLLIIALNILMCQKLKEFFL